MARVEGLPERETNDPIAKLGAEYISLLREAHSIRRPLELNEEQAQRVEDVITRIKSTIPEISEESLKKMVFDNPNDITLTPARKGWVTGGPAPYDDGEFHVLARNWNNPELANNRQIAEEYYGVTQVEVDFLSRGATALPPTPTLILRAA